MWTLRDRVHSAGENQIEIRLNPEQPELFHSRTIQGCFSYPVLMTNAEQIKKEVETLRQLGLEAATRMFDRDCDRLRRFMIHRTDRRLLRRLDWDDVLQETYLVIQRRLKEFIEGARVPFYVWTRGLAGQVLIDLHRRHLGAEVRSLNREVSIHDQLPFQSTATSIAGLLAASGTSPSRILMREEQMETLKSTLEQMNDKDREVLVMRHMEHMTNGEIAVALGINESAATKRYLRALRKVRDAVQRTQSRAQ